MKVLVALSISFLMFLTSWAGNNVKKVSGVKLTGKEVKYNISNPNTIYPRIQIGNRMIANDNDNFYFTELTDTELAKEEHFAKKGSAENELSTRAKYAQGPLNSILTLNFESGYALFLKEMVVIPNAKSIADIRNYSAWKRYDLSRLRTFHDFSNVFVSASDSTILIAGTPKEDYRHLFSVIDYKNQKVKMIDVIEDVRNAIANIKESCRDEKDKEIYNTAKTLETLGIDNITQLSINNAIENIDQYIENGGFEDIKLDPKPTIFNFNQSAYRNYYSHEDDHYMWELTRDYGYQGGA